MPPPKKHVKYFFRTHFLSGVTHVHTAARPHAATAIVRVLITISIIDRSLLCIAQCRIRQSHGFKSFIGMGCRIFIGVYF